MSKILATDVGVGAGGRGVSVSPGYGVIVSGWTSGFLLLFGHVAASNPCQPELSD